MVGNPFRTNHMARKLLLPLAALLVCVLCSSLTRTASAVTGSEFKAGRIMDDAIFFNPTVMDSTSIQNFLNSKLPSCDTNGSKSYNGGAQTRAQYAQANGKPQPPYVCLKDYTQNIPAMSADAYCGGSIGGGIKTAAMIINDVSKACNISPKVLIILLQKEQSLVTDDWPWPVQYDKATGFSCPDTAACDPAYAGFFYQVYYAARQYQRYAKLPNNYQYRAGRSSNIQYSPTSSCGSSSVFITNQATAGLYNYTPYQPNAAALNNLNGTGDSCSAYGNRNFWRLFNDWFGTTITDFKWATSGYTVLDKTESAILDPGQLKPGEEYIVKLQATNIGSATWTSSGPTPVTLATNLNQGHDSFLCTNTWLLCSRPAYLQESGSIAPGQSANFRFKIKVPYQPGMYRESFKPVAEYVTWFNDVTESLGIRVVSPGTYKWTTTGYRILDETESTYMDSGDLRANTRYIVKLQATNVGTATWFKDGTTPVLAATNYPQGHDSFICDNSWLFCSRPVSLQEPSVAPGQIGNFRFYFKTPSTPGTYHEYFKPVAENYAWFNDVPEDMGMIVH